MHICLFRWFIGLIFALIVPAFNTFISLRCMFLFIPRFMSWHSFTSPSTICHDRYPCRSGCRFPVRKVFRVGSPQVPSHDFWLVNVIESRAVQHQGTHTHCHYGKHLHGRHHSHRYCRHFAYHLWRRVVNWQAPLPWHPGSAARVLLRWHSPSIPCVALKHDLARCPRPVCIIERHAF